MPVCSCEACLAWTHKDIDGQWKPGRMLDASTAKGHKYATAMKRKLERAYKRSRSQGEEASDGDDQDEGDASADTPGDTSVKNAIFLTTLGEPLRQELPMRGRDAAGTGPSKDSKKPRRRSRSAQPAPSANVDTPATVGDEDSPEHSALIGERKAELASLESALALRSRMVSPYSKLKFQSSPASPNDPPAELEYNHADSFQLIVHRAWVSGELRRLRAYEPLGEDTADRHLKVMVRDFQKEFERLERLELKAWEQVMVSSGVLYMDIPGFDWVPAPSVDVFNPNNAGMPTFIIAALFLVTILHTLMGVSRPHAQLVSATIRVVLFGAMTWKSPIAQSMLSKSRKSLLRNVPLDVRASLKALKLEPKVIIYATCPSCSAIYPPSSNRDDPYPHRCTHSETDKGLCDTPLVFCDELPSTKKRRAMRVVYRPIRAFSYHEMKAYVASMLLRSGVEDHFENSFKLPKTARKGKWSDVTDAPAIREFRGPDGKTYFSVQANGELHLVFSLFVDWFNPHGNKSAGKSHSVGGIYLACLNLPPHLRFRPEYIYLAGVIPGPKEPSLHELNHFLRPLVDELLEFWHAGVYVKETANRPTGRPVRAAVIPLVCDLPALRKVAGLHGHGSIHFCSFCPLTLRDISNPDRSTWPTGRTWSEHLKLATEWRDAATQKQRDDLVKLHGVRWSELLRLEYWDPTKFALVDTMHNLFLGELRHHCMEIFGIGQVKTNPGGGRQAAEHDQAQQQIQLDHVLRLVKESKNVRLADMRKDYLVAVTRYNQVFVPGKDPTRRQIADALINWYNLKKADAGFAVNLPPTHDKPTSLFTLPGEDLEEEKSAPYRVFQGEVLKTLRGDIVRTVVPTWVEKPPSNIGEAGHGKLKSDQWRTLCTIFMVITLVRLWGRSAATPEERAVLENFVSLIVAVDAATRRSMSVERAELYDQNMERYIKGLRDLFDEKLRPNHHLALHLKECLLLFGPVHGWWAYPFERLNGLLQRLNTNHKPGGFSTTFMKYFYLGTGLRWLLKNITWPHDDVYSDWTSALSSAFKEASRGTRYTDIASLLSTPDTPFEYNEKREEALPRPLYDELYALICRRTKTAFQSAYDGTRTGVALLPSDAQLVKDIMRGGVTFATLRSGRRNAFVMCRRPEGTSTFAGCIEDIFYHRRREGSKKILEPFVVVREYLSLSQDDEAHDPFKAFPDLETKLYYADFRPHARVVPLSDVVCHFAALTYTPEEVGRPCIIARGLDRE